MTENTPAYQAYLKKRAKAMAKSGAVDYDEPAASAAPKKAPAAKPAAAAPAKNKFALFGSGINPKCTICGKTSYAAETIKYDGRAYHNFCLKCAECGKKLVAGTVGGSKWESEDKPPTVYCKTHWDRMVQAAGGGMAFSKGGVPNWKKK